MSISKPDRLIQPNTVPVQERTENDGTTEYWGRARVLTALTSDAAWQIRQTVTIGGQKRVMWANDGMYESVWDNRASYFPPPDPPSLPPVPTADIFSTSFTGAASFVRVENNNLIPSLGTTYSFSCWVKFADVSGFGGSGGRIIRIFNNDAPDTNHLSFGSYLSGGSFYLEMNVVDDASTMNRVVDNRALSNNTWYHAVAVRDGSNATIYLNGLSHVSSSQALGNITGTAAVIGADGNLSTHSNLLVGKLDELAVWNIALSSAQVTELYNGGAWKASRSTSFASHAVLIYQMGDSDSFPVLSDSSGNYNNGYMTNMDLNAFVTDTP